ncbi:type II secretion system protein GspG [Candidatus Auribacterota bacterium]
MIELLAAIFIIILLAGITVPAFRSAYSRSKISKAKSDIAKFEIGANQYNVDWGIYPSSTSLNMYLSLKQESPTTKKPYMIFKEEDIKNNQPIDPWGKPYMYIYPGTHNSFRYDIYSFGPDGTDDSGAGDDINNWSK